MKRLLVCAALAISAISFADHREDTRVSIVPYPELSIIHVGSENFEEVIHQNKFVIVDAYADWCGPCRRFAPVFSKAHTVFGEKAVFAKLNVGAESPLANKLQIRSLPTIVYFKEGKEIGRQVGAMPEKEFFEQVTSFLNN